MHSLNIRWTWKCLRYLHRTIVPNKSLLISRRLLHITVSPKQNAQDPRLGKVLEDDFAVLRSSYRAPKYPIVLAHGLLGFDELHPAGHNLPGIEYWYGITQALAAKNVKVMTAAVPPAGEIQERAERLAEAIERQVNGQPVNIIACVFPLLSISF